MTCPDSCTPQPKNHLVPPTGANGSHSKQNAVCGRYEGMENNDIINIHIYIYIYIYGFYLSLLQLYLRICLRRGGWILEINVGLAMVEGGWDGASAVLSERLRR